MINGFGPGPSPQGLILKVKHLLYCTVDSSSFFVGDNLMCKTDRCRISGYTVHFQNNTYGLISVAEQDPVNLAGPEFILNLNE